MGFPIVPFEMGQLSLDIYIDNSVNIYNFRPVILNLIFA